MKTKWTLLGIGGIGAIVLASALAHGADLQPMVATGLSGNLHIHQVVPVSVCSDLEFDTPVVGGRLEIAPADGIDVTGGKRFTFTRMSVFFGGFHTHVSCLGNDDDETYSEVGTQLGRAVTFVGVPAGGGVYNFTIPAAAFLVHESSVRQHNSDPIGPDNSFKHPAEDVTGSIDLTLGKVHLHVKVVSVLHTEVGDAPGSQTADIDGTLTFPDADGDGVPDRSDNCRFTPNADQTPVGTPVITAPPGVTLASCADHHFGVAKAIDVCDARAVTVTNNAPGTFAIGPNVVTWSGNDGLHPIANATQTVTIVDTTPPIITSMPPDIHLNDCKGTALGLPTATDDCAGTVTFTNNAPPKFFVGATAVTWTAHDVSSNVSTSIQTVTVVDTVPPTVACVPAGPPGGTFQVSASDACDTPVIRLGSFVLANGERIKINETGQPGVTLINVVNGIRHFHVGKGQAVITATDASSNVASAACQ